VNGTLAMHIAAPSRAPLTWLIALLLLAPSAHAYLDPNTGSMILSAIVGIFATVALAVKTWWYRLKGLVRRLRQAPPPAEPKSPAPADPRKPD